MEIDDLARQLRRLLRGRGLLAPNIAGNVGPAVRRACRVGDGDEPVIVRAKVTGCVRAYSAALPDDLRLAAPDVPLNRINSD